MPRDIYIDLIQPVPESPTGTQTGTGGVVDPSKLVTADTQLFIAPSPYFPYVKDYGGTVPDTEFTTATGLPAEERRGMYGGYPTRDLNTLGSYANLQISGPLTLRAMWRMLTASSSINIADYGAGGTAEATNSQWNFNIISAMPSFFAEQGAGIDHEAVWVLPGKLPVDIEFHVEFQRDALGDVRCWVNGDRLLQIDSVTNVTDNGNGSAGDFTATGGSTAVLGALGGIGATTAVDLYFVQVEDVEAGSAAAEAAATGLTAWSADQSTFLFRDDHAAVGSEANVTLCLEPTATDLVDRAGLLNDATDWNTEGATLQFFENAGYWIDDSEWESVNLAGLINTGDTTVSAVVMYNSNGTQCLSLGEWVGADIEANNFLWLITLNASSVDVFWEAGAGTNYTASWSLPTTLAQHDVFEIQFTRVDNGGGTSDMQLFIRYYPSATWQACTVTVSPGGGGGVGTDTATGVPTPTGGTNDYLSINRGSANHWFRQLVVRDQAVDPTV